MFTALNTFSVNFVASATFVPETKTVLFTINEYKLSANSKLLGSSAPITFGVVAMEYFLLFGSSRSGE